MNFVMMIFQVESTPINLKPKSTWEEMLNVESKTNFGTLILDSFSIIPRIPEPVPVLNNFFSINKINSVESYGFVSYFRTHQFPATLS